MLGMIFWVNNAYCCDLDPVIKDFSNNKIQVANQRATICKQMLTQFKIAAKAAEPENIKGEND